MAPVPSKESSSAPLADWFFISGASTPILNLQTTYLSTDFLQGVDSEQLRWGNNNTEETIQDPPQPPLEQTIEEERTSDGDRDNPELTQRTPRQSKRSSYQRLSRLSDEATLSIASLALSPDKGTKGTDSNRSSTTIKGIQINGTGSLSDLDFEKALRKFATERESFLIDLSHSAGAVVPNRPKARPKTQRIVNEDNAGLKSGVGSMRRRISFRDMSSVKRQSSVNRQCG
ncbi:MAG: hypothetical protein Q9223_006772 [Gallowayella weberi]